MKIAVVGLGGVGGYIAAELVKTEHKVTGFARGKHLLTIQKNGLSIIEDTETKNISLDARELSEAEGVYDLVLFCVKSYDFRDSYMQIAKHVDSKTILLSLSNGVQNGDILRELSSSVVLDGCVYILAHIQEAGVVRKKGKVFALVFGGKKDASEKLGKLFEETGLRYKVSEDIQRDIWKKYIFISAYATLTSYYDKPIGYINEYFYDEVKAVLEEISHVAEVKGTDIKNEIEKSLESAAKVPYDSSTSMHLDFQNKKQTELESLSGYIIQEAQRLGVEAPLMEKMYNTLKLSV